LLFLVVAKKIAIQDAGRKFVTLLVKVSKNRKAKDVGCQIGTLMSIMIKKVA